MAKKEQAIRKVNEATDPHEGEEQHVVVAESEQEICGVGGCTTSYSNPEVMIRHRQRAHGIGLPQRGVIENQQRRRTV